MATYEIHIPEVVEFRKHIRLVLTFLIRYLKMVEQEQMPDKGVEGILSQADAVNLLTVMEVAGAEAELKISDYDLLVIYAAHDIMSKLLIHENGEIAAAKILAILAENHELKEFKDFRNHFIKTNVHILEDTEAKMPDLDGLAELKKKLAALEI